MLSLQLLIYRTDFCISRRSLEHDRLGKALQTFPQGNLLELLLPYHTVASAKYLVDDFIQTCLFYFQHKQNLQKLIKLFHVSANKIQWQPSIYGLKLGINSEQLTNSIAMQYGAKSLGLSCWAWPCKNRALGLYEYVVATLTSRLFSFLQS